MTPVHCNGQEGQSLKNWEGLSADSRACGISPGKRERPPCSEGSFSKQRQILCVENRKPKGTGNMRGEHMENPKIMSKSGFKVAPKTLHSTYLAPYIGGCSKWWTPFWVVLAGSQKEPAKGGFPYFEIHSYERRPFFGSGPQICSEAFAGHSLQSTNKAKLFPWRLLILPAVFLIGGHSFVDICAEACKLLEQENTGCGFCPGPTLGAVLKTTATRHEFDNSRNPLATPVRRLPRPIEVVIFS